MRLTGSGLGLGLVAVVTLGSLNGCGRVNFDFVATTDGAAQDADGVINDAGPDANPLGTIDAAVDPLCVPDPALFTSGCLDGTGPLGYWRFDQDVVAPIPDRSGRMPCTPLNSAGGQAEQGGWNLNAGTLSPDGVDASALMQKMVDAKQGTLLIWLMTDTVQDTPIIELKDQSSSRISILQTPTGTQGKFEGASVNVSTLLNSGTPHMLVISDDGANISYGDTQGSGYAWAPTFAWNTASAALAIGPWTGLVIQAAVYDRALSSPERNCLRALGASVVP
jgi:hypothetical protein